MSRIPRQRFLRRWKRVADLCLLSLPNFLRHAPARGFLKCISSRMSTDVSRTRSEHFVECPRISNTYHGRPCRKHLTRRNELPMRMQRPYPSRMPRVRSSAVQTTVTVIDNICDLLRTWRICMQAAAVLTAERAAATRALTSHPCHHIVEMVARAPATDRTRPRSHQPGHLPPLPTRMVLVPAFTAEMVVMDVGDLDLPTCLTDRITTGFSRVAFVHHFSSPVSLWFPITCHCI